jgi:ribose 1,5-bisphosphokinase PhnN
LRFIDLATASAIALFSIYLIIQSNPSSFILAYNANKDRIALRNYLFDLLRRTGFQYIQNASPSELCSLSSRYSNSSLVVNISTDNKICVNVYSQAICVDLSFTLIGKEVFASACKERQ